MTDLVPGDAPSCRWQFEVVVRSAKGGFDFGGPFGRGKRGDRHIGLAWGDVAGNGTFSLFRAAKLRLEDIASAVIEDASLPGRRLVGRLGLTDAQGQPRCARVRRQDITWSAEPA